MAQGDFLRALYDEADVTWYNDRDNRVGSRKFVQEDGELKVVYFDRDGKRLAVAREYRSYMDKPYVENKDRDGNLLWRARIEVNVMNDPNIAIYVRGSKEKDIFVSKDEMDRILEDYRKENGFLPGEEGKDKNKEEKKEEKKGKKEERQEEEQKGSDPNPNDRGEQTHEHTGASESKYATGVPFFLGICLFLGIGLHILFTFLHAQMDTILRYGRLLFAYGTCPIMVLLFFLMCRTKDTPEELRTFKRVHLIVYVLGCAFMSYMANFIFADQELDFFPQIPNEDLRAICFLAVCFVPTLVMGLFSGIWARTRKNKPSHWLYEKVSLKSMLLMRIGNLIVIAVPLLVVILFEGFEPGELGSILFLMFALPFLALMLFLVSTILHLPYRWLSRKF